MRENPEISIIVPVYNCEPYIEECLKSISNQAFKDFEALIVNDGSTDNSENIIMDFIKKDDRFKLLTKKNGGQSSARNLGLRCAKGKYIAFLDSDDFIKPEFFEKLHTRAEENKLDIVMSGIEVHNEITGEITADDPYFSLLCFNENFDNKIFDYNSCLDFIFRICVVPWNKLYKRRFLNKNNLRFIEGLNFEDNVFFLEAFLKAQRVEIVQEALVCYRFFSLTSYSRTNDKQDFKKLDFFKIVKLQEKILKQNDLYEALKENFEKHKAGTLNYWYKKITYPKAKIIYFALLKLDEIYNKTKMFIFSKK